MDFLSDEQTTCPKRYGRTRPLQRWSGAEHLRYHNIPCRAPQGSLRIWLQDKKRGFFISLKSRLTLLDVRLLRALGTKGTMRRTFLFLVGSICVFAQQPDLAVVQKIAGTVGFYTNDGRLVSEVKVGKHPHEAVLSPDGKFLYVTNNGILWMTDAGEGGNTISIVDVTSRRNVGSIELGRYHRPHGIDLDPGTGRLVVTIENPSGLLLVDPLQRKVLKMYDVKGEAPHMVLLSPDGKRAYVSNTGTGTLSIVDLETSKVNVIPSAARPQGTAFSPDRKTIYMTNLDGNSISIFDAAKSERTGMIQTGKGPCRIAATPDGKTLVYALQNAEAVGFADAVSRKEVQQVPIGGKLVSLTLSRDKRVAYSSAQEQDKIFVISIADRKIIRVIATPKGSGPDPVIALR
jgi:YVTN family beta-propeller protein